MNNPVFKAEACPFCGAAAHFGTAMMRFKRVLCERAFIGCRRCHFTRDFTSLAQAFQWWNKRAYGR